MKNLFISLLAVLTAMYTTAQNGDGLYVPGAISYQAIAKDTSGNPVSGATVSLRASILRDTTNGPLDWEETHSATTDATGLFEIMIGNGTRTGGEKERFLDIDWGSAKHFLKMEIDITGGNNFSFATVMQFCAIPYAFKATVADSLSGISTDSLRMAAEGAGGGGACPCDLQEVYNNSTLAVINENASPNGGIKIFNAPNPNPNPPYVLDLYASSDHTNPSTGGGVLRCWTEYNPPYNSTVMPTLSIENYGLGDGLSMINGFWGNISTQPASWVYNVSDCPVIFARQDGYNSIAPTIFTLEPGIRCEAIRLGDGGFFQLHDNSPSSIASAVRAEILNGPISSAPIHVQAGSFVTFEDESVADAVHIQTDGIGDPLQPPLPTGNGNALSCLITNPSNELNVIQAETDGKGRAGYFFNTNISNHSNVLEVTGDGDGARINAYNINPLDPTGKNIGHFKLFNSASTCYSVFAEANSTGNGMGSFISGSGIAGFFGTLSSSNTVTIYSVNQGPGVGIFSTSNGNGIMSLCNGNIPTRALYARHNPFVASNGYAGYFQGDVRVVGTLTKTVVAAFVKNQSGVEKLNYAEESTENWFTTYGEGQLVNGSATITIEPEFLSTVNTDSTYHVYIQMEGPCNNAGVYVTNKTSTTFDVVQQNSGSNCNASFSYRIAAKRIGFESLYMGTLAQTSDAANQYIQAYFPEIITDNEEMVADMELIKDNVLPLNYSFTEPLSLSHLQATQPRNLHSYEELINQSKEKAGVPD